MSYSHGVKVNAREKRKSRIRGKISGTAERPRLCVFRSNKYVFCQIIDDSKGATLVSCGSLDLEKEKRPRSKMEQANLVGERLAQKALEAKVKSVVFDRSGYVYHGCVKRLAQSAREHGLEF